VTTIPKAITVLVVRPDASTESLELGGDPAARLARFQLIVGGYIQTIAGDGWAAYCWEDAKDEGQQPNHRAGAIARRLGWVFMPSDYLAGTVVFFGRKAGPYEQSVTQHILDVARSVAEDLGPAPVRPGRRRRMTAAELKRHHVLDRSRNYRESDDGYSDMAAEEKRGWRAIANWGRDGWNLGDWPYVVIYTRDGCEQCHSHAKIECDAGFMLMQIVEGDRTEWRFASPDERNAAIDYLFLWYAAGHHWAPVTTDQREALDMGYPLAISDKWGGPYQPD
jgi:hypothetical protein